MKKLIILTMKMYAKKPVEHKPKLIVEHKPKLIVVGASAYPRTMELAHILVRSILKSFVRLQMKWAPI